MAIWKRKKKEKKSHDNFQKEEITTPSDESVSTVTFAEEPVAKEETPPLEKPSEVKEISAVPLDTSAGVILRGKKISGFFGKGFWGILSILILPPVLVFALSILIIVCMLVFPLLAVVLIALVPVVFVTLSVFLIALPVVFPLLVLFLLITGKGRLLVASEGKWIDLEMFGKKYSFK